MELSNADLVKAIRCCGNPGVECKECPAYQPCKHEYAWDLDLQAADRIERLGKELAMTRYDALNLAKKVNILMKRQDRAIEILKTIEWVGSGAKGRISDAISILYGEEPENENDNMV